MVGFRLRQLLAALLLAGSAVAFGRVGLEDLNVVATPYLALAVVLVIAAFGVASTAWWARLVALGWACTAGIEGAYEVFLPTPDGVPLLLVGAVLTLSLAGPGMLARFEGAAPPPMTWGQPGMALVRATVITGIAGLMAMTASLPYRQPQTGCVIGPPYTWSLDLPLFWLMAPLTAGAFLLARQKTAGLLLLALGVSGSVIALVFLQGPPGTRLILFFGPALICGWALFLLYLPRMLRFLRG